MFTRLKAPQLYLLIYPIVVIREPGYRQPSFHERKAEALAFSHENAYGKSVIGRASTLGTKSTPQRFATAPVEFIFSQPNEFFPRLTTNKHDVCWQKW